MKAVQEKPKGRPKGEPRFTIQRHFMFDAETNDKLKKMADGNESACLRYLINKEYQKLARFL